MSDAYIPYEQIPEHLGIKKGDKIYLASDVLMISYIAKLHGETFNPDKMLNAFIQQIGPAGTLLIPTFNFVFSNEGHYDIRNSECHVGALGNAALQREDFKRTFHPMHSFAVWGKDQEKLCAMKNDNSFGEDSPFAYMKEQRVRQIMLGTDYKRSMTFVHYVEYMVKVPYRFIKYFTGSYINLDGVETEITIPYYARDLSLGSEEHFNRLGKILEENGVSKKYDFNGVTVYVVELKESYGFIKKDIIENRCANLYDFHVDRDLIWEQQK